MEHSLSDYALDSLCDKVSHSAKGIGKRSADDDAIVSIRHYVRQASLGSLILWKVMLHDSICTQFKPNDHRRRRAFSEWAEVNIGTGPQFPLNIFSVMKYT